MKFIGIIGLILMFSGHAFGQRNMNPNGKQKKDMFGGASDFSEYRPMGLQLSLGPTFMLTRKVPVTNRFTNGSRPFDLTIQPKGLPGIFVEAGMVHYPKKRSKLSERLNYIFVSYIDWGVGFKLLRGQETTEINALDPITFQEIGSPTTTTGKFNNGFISARGTVHKNFYLGKKYFIDNGLGVNVDYNIMRSSEASPYTAALVTFEPSIHRFHKPFVAQMHYELGLGIRLSRRSFVVISAQAPIMGFYEWRGGASALKWFNSNYYPLTLKVKWAYLFKKKNKGCAPALTNDQDKNTMKGK